MSGNSEFPRLYPREPLSHQMDCERPHGGGLARGPQRVPRSLPEVTLWSPSNSPISMARCANVLKQQRLGTQKQECPGGSPEGTGSLSTRPNWGEGALVQSPPLKHTPAACLDPCHDDFPFSFAGQGPPGFIFP